MRNKLEYLNRLEQLNAKLIRLKFEIEQTKDELTTFEIKVKDLLSNKIDLKDLQIKKIIRDDRNRPFKIHFNFKGARFFIKESDDDYFGFELALFKVQENSHHSIMKAKKIEISTFNEGVRYFIQKNKVFSHWDKYDFLERLINVFGIDFIKGALENE